MEYSYAYLYIILVLLVVFFMSMVIYTMYLTQQKVMSVAVTSADLAFFPVRVTAAVVRAFYKLVIFGFDVTLIGLRFALVCFRWILVFLELIIEVYQFPVIVMIGIVQRVRRWRKPKNVKEANKVDHKSKAVEDVAVKPTVQEDQVLKSGKVRVPFSSRKMVLANGMVNLVSANVNKLMTIREFVRKRAGLTNP